MDITLKSFLGDKRVTVDDKVTVKTLKLLIEKNYGIECQEQQLMFNNDILEKNEDLLQNYNIRNGSVINVIFKSSDVEARINMPNKPDLVLHVKSENKVSELKSKIQDKSGMPSDEQVILYKGSELEDDNKLLHYNISGLCILVVIPKVTANNQCVILQTESEKTNNSHLKNKMSSQTEANAKSQLILYNDSLLKTKSNENEDSLTPVSIKKIGEMRIFVKTLDGKECAMETCINESISEIKKKIKDKLIIDPDEQTLLFQGAMLDNDKTVNEYGICDNSVIFLVVRLRSGPKIFVETVDGKRIPIEIFGNESIRYLKRKIYEELRIDPYEQRLVFQGGILEDKETLDKYKICSNSRITLVVILKYQIFVKINDGKTIEIKIFMKDTIRKIRKKIQDKIGLDPGQLLFQGLILDDDKTAGEYQICEKSVINISNRQREAGKCSIS